MAARRTTSAGVDRFRDLGKVMWLLAALRVVWWFTSPVTPDSTPGDQLLASTILLVGHGFVYMFGGRLRAKKGPLPYVVIQFTLAASVGLFSLSLWLAIVLFVAFGVQTWALLRHHGPAVIAVTAFMLGIAVSFSLGWNLARGAATALSLAGVALVVGSLTGKARRS